MSDTMLAEPSTDLAPMQEESGPSVFGAWFKEMRESKDLSVRDVGKALHVSGSYINQLEKGKHKVLQEHHWPNVAKMFGVSLGEVIEKAIQSSPLKLDFVDRPGPKAKMYATLVQLDMENKLGVELVREITSTVNRYK